MHMKSIFNYKLLLMINKILTFFFTISFLLFLSFCRPGNPSKSVLIPLFKDNGKVIDSLRTVYQSEKVEFENWEADDATDSSLTVSFINSKKLPATETESANEFKAIAYSIHQSIVDTSQYKSYYIIFVTRETAGMTVNSSHTAGMEVSVKAF